MAQMTPHIIANPAKQVRTSSSRNIANNLRQPVSQAKSSLNQTIGPQNISFIKQPLA